MKKRLFTPFIWLVCFLCLAATKLDAATLQAILVGDTNDGSIGGSVRTDLKSMRNQMKDIAAQTGMQLNIIEFKGKETQPNVVLTAIEDLHVNSDDVVVLYLSMHGYRTPSKKTPWPNVYFGNTHSGVETDFLNQTILNKQPRFFLSITDSCNNEVPDGIIHTAVKRAAFNLFYNPERTKGNYKELFLNSKGFIIASGCSPGEVSWGNSQIGGFFTHSFLESLQSELTGFYKADWQILMDLAVAKVVDMTYTFEDQQTPQYIIHLDE